MPNDFRTVLDTARADIAALKNVGGASQAQLDAVLAKIDAGLAAAAPPPAPTPAPAMATSPVAPSKLTSGSNP